MLRVDLSGAQVITTRLKPGRDEDLPTLVAQLRAAEQPGSSLVHSSATRDVKHPNRVTVFVVFESEEKAGRAKTTLVARRSPGVWGDDHGVLRGCTGVHGLDRR
jgi:hypothetical protein